MKRVVSKKKVIKFTIIIIVAISVIIGAVFLVKAITKKSEKPITPVTVIDKLEKYGYNLTETETEYYKLLFGNLKEVLNKDDVDNDKYAEILSQLFITDFYTLNNKTTKNDIGGLEFIYTDYKTDFEKSAKSTIYNTVESNVYGDRKQELPTVTKVTVEESAQKSFKYLEKEDKQAYYITLSVEYDKDLGYPKKVELVIIHSNDKLEISKMK